MEFTVSQIAAFLHGEVVGNQNILINDVSKIEEGIPGSLTFLANPKYTEHIYTTKASVVLVNKTFIPEKEINATLIKVDDAYGSLAKLMDLYVQSLPQKKGIEIPSFVSTKASYGENVYIGAFAYIDDDVKIGNNVKIYPHCWIGRGSVIKDNTIIYASVKIYPETKIGNSCVLQAGCVVGSDGFGFAPQADGTYTKLNQIGNVVLEDNVEIGANTTIDCATMGSTLIKKGVKIDNLVQVAHNVVIGENTVMAAHVGVAGSTTIGQHCVFGGQAGISGHIKIGNNVTVAAKTGAVKSIKDGQTIMGLYNIEASRFKRAYAVFRNLPELYADVQKLKKDTKN